MKTSKFKVVIVALFAILFAGCAKEEVDKTLIDHLKDNTWYVSYYLDSGKDETSNFSGYSLDFTDEMLINASKGGTSSSGSWFLTDNSSKIVIVMSNVTNYLENLSNQWVVIERTNDVLKLKDDSDDGEILHLTRN